MATLKLLKTLGMSGPTTTTSFTISGEGTQSSPYFGNSTNSGLHNTTANATFSIVGSGTATLQYDVDISSETNFDFGRIIKNGVNQLQVSGTSNHQGTFSVSGGDTVQVQYSKDGSVNAGLDVFQINALFIIGSPNLRFLGAATFKFIDPLVTANPDIPSFSMSNCISGFGVLCTYTWTVRNNDAATATVDSGPSNPPSYDSRSLASNTTSTTITQTSVDSFTDGFTAFGTVFARATASGKATSTIIEATTSTPL